MPARIKISHFSHKLKASLRYMIGKSLTAYVLTSESVSSHYRALAFFYDKSWINKWNKIIEHWSSCLPIINRSSKCFFTCPSITRIFGTPKSFLEPQDKFFIATRYFETTMPLITVAIFALFNSANIKATFSINDSSKIRELFRSLSCMKLNQFSHRHPFVYTSITLNELKIHAERLSEKGPQGYATV